MVVVLLRGTSGSGKTYVATQVIRRAGPQTGTFPLGPRGKVGGYYWVEKKLAVVGSYEAEGCGGCDKFSWKGFADDACEEIYTQAALGRNVLLEGLMVSTWGSARLKALNDAAGLVIVHLTTPLDVCLAAVACRREARAAAAGKAPPAPLNPTNTTAKYNGLITGTRTNRAAGLTVEEHDRGSALTRTLELLGV